MAMTTKEQERKALAAIRKIVDGLGDDSYIVAAFDGVWKTAESNIDNDWVCSAVEDARIAGIGEGREEYGQKVANLEKTVKGLTLKLELERANADTHKKAAEYNYPSSMAQEVNGLWSPAPNAPNRAVIVPTLQYPLRNNLLKKGMVFGADFSVRIVKAV